MLRNYLSASSLGALSILVLGGCHADPVAPKIIMRDSVRDARVPTMSLDALFEAFDHSHPGFGGAYLSDGTLVIRMKDAADTIGVARDFREQWDLQREKGPRFDPATDADIVSGSPVTIVRAQFGFGELVRWKRSVADDLIADDGVYSIDVDEVENRISVGVRDAATAARMEELWVRASIPLSAVRTFVTAGSKPVSANLADTQRPLTGGFLVGPVGCTMTGTALQSGAHLMITASHCTASVNALDYGPTWQNNPGASFGYESIDPNAYRCGTLFSPKWCRHADVAAYNVNYIPADPADTLTWFPGLIAKTTYPTNGVDQSYGSVVVDSSDPYWYVTSTYNAVMVGYTVHKVGLVSGWTFGNVTSTCVDKKDTTNNVWNVCSDIAGLYDDFGDSGSPVFVAGALSTAGFVGIVWGKDPGSSVIISNFGQMKQDLGVFSFW